jgi:hypothetical protein
VESDKYQCFCWMHCLHFQNTCRRHYATLHSTDHKQCDYIIKFHLPDNPKTLFSIFSLTAHTHPIFCPLCESRNPICSKLMLIHLSKYKVWPNSSAFNEVITDVKEWARISYKGFLKRKWLQRTHLRGVCSRISIKLGSNVCFKLNEVQGQIISALKHGNM